MELFGRRYAQIILNMMALVGWLCITFAKGIGALYAGRIIQGVKAGGYILSVMTLSEYVVPKRRGYFQTIKFLFINVGNVFCRTLSLVCTWRQIAGIALIISFLGAVLPFYWPESPPYLAMKGRFEECAKSYKWLNPKCENSLELNELILAQTNERKRRKLEKKNRSKFFWVKIIIQKDFLKSFFVSVLISLMLLSTCKDYFSTYVIQFMMELIGDRAIATYSSIAIDFLIILGMICSCFVVTSIKRRKILLSFGSASILVMFIISLLVFLKNKSTILAATGWLIPLLVALHCFILNLGLYSVGIIIISEIYGLAHRALGSAVSGVIMLSCYALSLKLIPYSIQRLGLDLTFAICAVSVAVCVVLVYILMPETKDRTLQDIENEMKGIERTKVEGRSMLLSK